MFKPFRVTLMVLLSVFVLLSLSFAEDLTITTYYPSPYGSYNQLNVAGNTYLAVTSGKVGIGTATPDGNLTIYTTAGGVNKLISIGYANANGSGADISFAGIGSGLTYNQIEAGINGNGYMRFSNYYSGSLQEVMRLSGGNVGIGTTNPGYTLEVIGSGRVSGAFSKGSGTFDIPHPDPEKEKAGWRLRHSFVESPTRGDNLYRWSVNVVNKAALISLPDYFKYLNENVQVWVSPEMHFGRAYGKVDPGLTKITVTADSDGTYNVLAVGTRKDKVAKEGFDPRGLEYQKKIETSLLPQAK